MMKQKKINNMMKKNITDRHYEKSSNWWKKSSFFLFPKKSRHMNICIMGAKKLASWIHYIWYHGYNLFSIKILDLNVHMFLWYHFYVSNLCYHQLAICHRVLYEVGATVNGDWYVKFSNALAYMFFFNYSGFNWISAWTIGKYKLVLNLIQFEI